MKSHKYEGMNPNMSPCTSMDMFSILSQMTVKVPFS